MRAGDVLITLDARDISEHTGQARASAVAAEKASARARTEQSAAEVDRAANAVSGRAGCSAWSGYFLAFLACRFSFSVF